MIETRPIQTTPDLSFTVDVAGDSEAPLVLLLHGFPQNRSVWRHQLPALAEAGFLAVAPDQRGYSPGARPKGVEAYGLSAIVDDAIAITERFRRARFHLVAHDFGAAAAWALAARAPEKLASLTILSRPHPDAFVASLSSDPDQATRSRHHKAFHDPNTAERLLANDAKGLRRLFENARVSPEDAARYVDCLGTPAALDAALDWYRAAGTSSRGIRPAPLGAIRVSTLYLWGTEDETVGRQAAEATANHVEAPYIFVPLEGLGHFCLDQTIDGINRPLLAHLLARTDADAPSRSQSSTHGPPSSHL